MKYLPLVEILGKFWGRKVPEHHSPLQKQKGHFMDAACYKNIWKFITWQPQILHQ